MEWNLSEKLIGAIIGFGGIGLLYWAELWRMYRRHKRLCRQDHEEWLAIHPEMRAKFGRRMP